MVHARFWIDRAPRESPHSDQGYPTPGWQVTGEDDVGASTVSTVSPPPGTPTLRHAPYLAFAEAVDFTSVQSTIE
jgi:hypothetical protein